MGLEPDEREDVRDDRQRERGQQFEPRAMMVLDLVTE